MKLHILIKNGGDGSNNLTYIIDSQVIKACEKFFDDSESEPGVDGDGFHYDTLNLPDGTTLESLGISKYSMLTKEDMLDEYSIDVDKMKKN